MDRACELVEWFVNTALASGASTWSMEQVASRHVIKLLETIRKTRRDKLSFAIFNFADLGVPQTRKRLLAGTPWLIAALLRKMARCERVSVADAIPKPRGTHVRGILFHKGYRPMRADERTSKRGSRNVFKRAGWGETCVPISAQGPTIVAGRNSGWWIRFEGGRTVRSVLSPTDVALLQTFPPEYKLPKRPQHLAFRLVGNAVPPTVSKALMQSVVAGER